MVSKKRRRRKRLKSRVIRFTADLSILVCLASTCAIDSESLIPFFVCGVSMLYLFIVGIANNWFE
jgi:transcription elongation factor Elf1